MGNADGEFLSGLIGWASRGLIENEMATERADRASGKVGIRPLHCTL